MTIPASARTTDDARRRKLLETAVAVFTRFGYRKTSMDEVARAAGVSRQGLYLHFSTKEELFGAAVEHALRTSLDAASQKLEAATQPLERRLVLAFDEWVGRFVGMMGPGASDLVEASKELVGPMVAEYDARFVETVAKAMRASRLIAAYKPSGLTARQLAETIHATALGLKHTSASRETFVHGMTVAVRALCAPLRETP
jgi:TetR/AcrR family transcriptional regulator, regulator of autoinduction and epiphytic fitness